MKPRKSALSNYINHQISINISKLIVFKILRNQFQFNVVYDHFLLKIIMRGFKFHPSSITQTKVRMPDGGS